MRTPTQAEYLRFVQECPRIFRGRNAVGLAALERIQDGSEEDVRTAPGEPEAPDYATVCHDIVQLARVLEYRYIQDEFLVSAPTAKHAESILAVHLQEGRLTTKSKRARRWIGSHQALHMIEMALVRAIADPRTNLPWDVVISRVHMVSALTCTGMRPNDLRGAAQDEVDANGGIIAGKEKDYTKWSDVDIRFRPSDGTWTALLTLRHVKGSTSARAKRQHDAKNDYTEYLESSDPDDATCLVRWTLVQALRTGQITHEELEVARRSRSHRVVWSHPERPFFPRSTACLTTPRRSTDTAAANVHPREVCDSNAFTDAVKWAGDESGVVFTGDESLSAYDFRRGQAAQASYVDAASSSKNNAAAAASLGYSGRSAENDELIARYQGALYTNYYGPRSRADQRLDSNGASIGSHEGSHARIVFANRPFVPARISENDVTAEVTRIGQANNITNRAGARGRLHDAHRRQFNDEEWAARDRGEEARNDGDAAQAAIDRRGWDVLTSLTDTDEFISYFSKINEYTIKSIPMANRTAGQYSAQDIAATFPRPLGCQDPPTVREHPCPHGCGYSSLLPSVAISHGLSCDRRARGGQPQPHPSDATSQAAAANTMAADANAGEAPTVTTAVGATVGGSAGQQKAAYMYKPHRCAGCDSDEVFTQGEAWQKHNNRVHHTFDLFTCPVPVQRQSLLADRGARIEYQTSSTTACGKTWDTRANAYCHLKKTHRIPPTEVKSYLKPFERPGRGAAKRAI